MQVGTPHSWQFVLGSFLKISIPDNGIAFLLLQAAPAVLLSRPLKNAHLLRCAHYSSLRRTQKYASFLIISRALHLAIFEQPVYKNLFNNL